MGDEGGQQRNDEYVNCNIGLLMRLAYVVCHIYVMLTSMFIEARVDNVITCIFCWDAYRLGLRVFA